MSTFAEHQTEITNLIARVFTVDSVTVFEPGAPETAVYRGILTTDSTAAYDQVAAALRPYKLTPVFRKVNQQHVIGLVEGIIEPSPTKLWVVWILGVLTFFSVIFTGAIFSLNMILSGSLSTNFFSYPGPEPQNYMDFLAAALGNLHLGLPFGLAMMGILVTHEFGHYLAARYHKTNVSLPYFLPMPFGPLGTLGAFIRLKEPPKNKRILHDIGVAGPLAGLVVAIPILLVGLALSPVEPISFASLPDGVAVTMEGNSVLYLLAKFITHGQLLPAPATYGGVSPVLYWLRYIFTGQPLPEGGLDVMLHPLAWAGWAGLLVTALNLIPAGQLDGGHALYVLFGEKARKVFPIILVGLGLLGLFWPGWWLWVVLIYFFGQYHAEPLDQITELNRGRRWVAIMVLVLFFFIFIPIPLIEISASGALF